MNPVIRSNCTFHTYESILLSPIWILNKEHSRLLRRAMRCTVSIITVWAITSDYVRDLIREIIAIFRTLNVGWKLPAHSAHWNMCLFHRLGWDDIWWRTFLANMVQAVSEVKWQSILRIKLLATLTTIKRDGGGLFIVKDIPQNIHSLCGSFVNILTTKHWTWALHYTKVYMVILFHFQYLYY
jgi:hypothetical protein